MSNLDASDYTAPPSSSGPSSADSGSQSPAPASSIAPPAVTAGITSVGYTPQPPTPQDYIQPDRQSPSQWGRHDFWSDLALNAPSPVRSPFLPQAHQMNQVYGQSLGFLGGNGSGLVAPYAMNALKYGIAYQQGLIKGQIARANYEAQLFALNAKQAEFNQQRELSDYRDAWDSAPNGSQAQRDAMQRIADHNNDATMQAALKVGPQQVEKMLHDRQQMWLNIGRANRQNAAQAKADATAQAWGLPSGDQSDQTPQTWGGQPQPAAALSPPSAAPSPPAAPAAPPGVTAGTSGSGAQSTAAPQGMPQIPANLQALPANVKEAGLSFIQNPTGAAETPAAAQSYGRWVQAQMDWLNNQSGLSGPQLTSALQRTMPNIAALTQNMRDYITGDPTGRYTGIPGFWSTLASLTQKQFPGWSAQGYATMQSLNTEYNNPNGRNIQTMRRASLAAGGAHDIFRALNSLPADARGGTRFARFLAEIRKTGFSSDPAFTDLSTAIRNYAAEVAAYQSGTGVVHVTTQEALVKLMSPVNSSWQIRQSIIDDADQVKIAMDAQRAQWDRWPALARTGPPPGWLQSDYDDVTAITRMDARTGAIQGRVPAGLRDVTPTSPVPSNPTVTQQDAEALRNYIATHAPDDPNVVRAKKILGIR